MQRVSGEVKRGCRADNYGRSWDLLQSDSRRLQLVETPDFKACITVPKVRLNEISCQFIGSKLGSHSRVDLGVKSPTLIWVWQGIR